MNNSHNYYNPNLKQRARELRSETGTKAEKFIWKALLSRRKTGVRFLRQRPIAYYIVDFFAPEIKLIIEIDGSSHLNSGVKDYKKQQYLEGLGFTVIRFKEGDVMWNLNEISFEIFRVIEVLSEKYGVVIGGRRRGED